MRLPVLGGLKAGIRGELFLLDIFAALLPELDGSVVDVGANLGQTLVKVKLADPKRRYYGFEPNPACFDYLEKLVSANRWSGITLFPVGLSDRTAIARLHAFSRRATDPKGSLKPEARPDVDPVYTKHVVVFDYAAVDALIDDPIALLKIDVEGSEYEIIASMQARISRDRPLVVFELMTVPAMEARHQQTIELLGSYGYRVYRIDRDSGRHWRGLTPLSSYVYAAVPAQSDYLAVPEKRLAMVERLAPQSSS